MVLMKCDFFYFIAICDIACALVNVNIKIIQQILCFDCLHWPCWVQSKPDHLDGQLEEIIQAKMKYFVSYKLRPEAKKKRYFIVHIARNTYLSF